MIIGYARVSTEDQKLDLQIHALKSVGCNRIFTDHGRSGFSFKRDGLAEAMRLLRPGDTLVVWRLDRLGRSLSGLVNIMEQLRTGNIHFRSLSENIDTASSSGKLMFHMMAALAEFERSLISERTRAGMAAAKVKGKRLGRPKSLSAEDLHVARQEIKTKGSSYNEVADMLSISERTLRRYIPLPSR